MCRNGFIIAAPNCPCAPASAAPGFVAQYRHPVIDQLPRRRVRHPALGGPRAHIMLGAVCDITGIHCLADQTPAAPTPKPAAEPVQMPREIGGPSGPEPTRYGDWEVKGRCSDF